MAIALSDLIQQIRYRTNTENSQFVTDQELTYMINAAMGELDDALVVKQEDYRLTSAIFTVSGTDQAASRFPLPADFYQLRGVDFYNQGNLPNPWVTLKQFNLQERNRYANPLLRTMYGVLGIYYKLEDGYVALIPYNGVTGQYQLWYVPICPTLVLTTDTLPAYMANQNWCEYIVMSCTAQILMKQNLDPSAFLDQKAHLKIRIEGMAGHRDSGEPKGVVDTRSSAYDYFNVGYPFVY